MSALFCLVLACPPAWLPTSPIPRAIVARGSPPSAGPIRATLAARSGSRDELSDGHRRMVELLAEIARESREEGPFFGQADALRLRARLDEIGEGNPRERWGVLRRLAFHELRLGNTQAAVERYQAAAALHESLGTTLPADKRNALLLDLAVAHLRWGEDRNCVARHSAQSCLLPIRSEGVHVDQAGSRAAIEVLEELLVLDPGSASARWLLNLAYMTVGEYPEGVREEWRAPPEVFESAVDYPAFTESAAEVGLATESLAGGALVDDFDGDGVLDVFVSTWDPAGQIRFFRGPGSTGATGGDAHGRFVERTEEAGLTGILGGLNLVHADYDGDGDLDVLVLRGAWMRERGRVPNSLLRNEGGGRFLDVTIAAGLAEVHYPTQTAAWADYDNDGDLDLYVGNETSPEVRAPCQLFRNEGGGRFLDVAREAGVENLLYAKGVAFGDYDGDRWPDIYVSNGPGQNRLYRNLGDGRFTDVAPALGVAGPENSFATWFWDWNNDGALDIFVAAYVPALEPAARSYLGLPAGMPSHALYQGDGQGGFRDVAEQVGLGRFTIVMGSNFGDLDQDGWLDMYLGTGYPGYEGLLPNVLYSNRAGAAFADVTAAAGLGHLQKGHGVSFADLDRDGDTDVFAEMGGAFPGDTFRNAFFRNPGNGAHWLDVRLVGVDSNRSGVGARIRCDFREDDRPRSVWRFVGTGGSFGGNPLTQRIGLGRARVVERLEVWWPTSDRRQVLEDVAAQRVVVIEEDRP